MAVFTPNTLSNISLATGAGQATAIHSNTTWQSAITGIDVHSLVEPTVALYQYYKARNFHTLHECYEYFEGVSKLSDGADICDLIHADIKLWQGERK